MTAEDLSRLLEESLVLWGVSGSIDIIDSTPPQLCVDQRAWITRGHIHADDPTSAMWELRTSQRTERLRSIATVLRRLREFLDSDFRSGRAIIGIRAPATERPT